MTTFAQRSLGSIFGLALGDAFGRPLEFTTGSRVRTKAVDLSRLMWTDDTHMSIYFAEAALSLKGEFSEEALGAALGEQLCRWRLDPLTPSTAPGNTCLAGAAAYARDRDWRSSGVRGSDGCGAVMRIAALPILYSGEQLTTAARVSALITHAHPNAPAATEALCWLQREVLEDGRLDPAMVLQVAARSRAAGHPPVVAEALEAAVDWARRNPAADWLDERAIPTYDGGWRSVSAVGLAVAACLRWGPRPALVIEKAARIQGDSDSVAAIAGMLVGAVNPAGLPSAWLESLFDRERLEGLAERLCAPPRGPRGRKLISSLQDPIRVAWLKGEHSGLGLTLAPGKKGPSTMSRVQWHRDIGIDLGDLKQQGVTLLIGLLEDHELRRYQLQGLSRRAAEKGIEFLWFSVPDQSVPTLEEAQNIVCRVNSQLLHGRERSRGERVVIHCLGGLGRSGTLTACVLRSRGLGPDEAMAAVRRVRPGAIENRRQERFVRGFLPLTE